jgi:glucose/arabinose dehydrogenase
MQRRIWTYGHRNVQGLARQSSTGRMWSVEHGSYRDDEVNALVKGSNYGWNPVRRVSSDPEYNEGANSPMTDFAIPGAQSAAAWSSGTPTIATSGADFVEGPAWGSLDGTLAVAALKGTSLRFFSVTSDLKATPVLVPEELSGTYGRLRGVRRGPDGALYVTTSNGSDDKILRITPRTPVG